MSDILLRYTGMPRTCGLAVQGGRATICVRPKRYSPITEVSQWPAASLHYPPLPCFSSPRWTVLHLKVPGQYPVAASARCCARHRMRLASVCRWLVMLAPALLVLGCATTGGTDLGISADGRLEPVPSSPSASSDGPRSDDHYIEPLRLNGDRASIWCADRASGESARYTIVDAVTIISGQRPEPGLLRFVDDVEFHLRADQREIAMRSASRIGYSDLAANRHRLEAVREAIAGR
ncbi:MAG: DUF1499 domain-containing protein [Gammaproteobacteria bacterium]|nr:DUF1499 domain-containing protein [Gammaproteobacteria bacterium]